MPIITPLLALSTITVMVNDEKRKIQEILSKPSMALKEEENTVSEIEKSKYTMQEMEQEHRMEICQLKSTITKITKALIDIDDNGLDILGPPYTMENKINDVYYVKNCRRLILPTKAIIPTEDTLMVNPLLLEPPIKTSTKLYLTPHQLRISQTPTKVEWKNEKVYLKDGKTLTKNLTIENFKAKNLNQQTNQKHEHQMDDAKIDPSIQFNDEAKVHSSLAISQIQQQAQEVQTEGNMEKIAEKVGKTLKDIP